MKSLVEYKNKNSYKIKIITVIRNPFDRCLSSFFQQNHDDMVYQHGSNPKNTIIMKNNIDDLKLFFYNELIADRCNLYNESILEMNTLFNIDIFSKMEKRDNSYYYEHELFELYILNFDKITSKEAVKYLNDTLSICINEIKCSNITSNKQYYEKFKNFKQLVLNDQYYKNYIVDKYKHISQIYFKFM
jgi:hypothetical protein